MLLQQPATAGGLIQPMIIASHSDNGTTYHLALSSPACNNFVAAIATTKLFNDVKRDGPERVAGLAGVTAFQQ